MDDIKTNKRLFDLVRYQRSELLQAGLITEDEYLYLLADAPLAKGGGSPSPRRLEDYDEIRAKMKSMEKALGEIAQQKLAAEMDDHSSEHADWESGYEAIVLIARTTLDSENDAGQATKTAK
jgi:hypothetical protein